MTPIDTVERNPGTSNAQKSLRDKVVAGATWNLSGQVFAQVWRLAANLVIARLVVPDAFGVMAMINVFIYSLQMLSDVGLRDTVIHDERGDEPDFLNTVWTIQALRGIFLYLLICVGAMPFARFYGLPELKWLLPVAGLTAPIRGFSSTSLLTAGRHIRPKWNVLVEISGTVAGSITSIIVALFRPDAWALVIGLVVASITFTIISYRFSTGHRHRFHWDRQAARAVSRFGTWVIPSSAMTILLRRGDTMVLGKVMNAATLGVYSIGANLALMPMNIFSQLAGSILQPVYAQTRFSPIVEARSKIRKVRFAISGACVAILWVLIGLSYWLFSWLYKPEYLDAYRFCQIVAMGIILRVSTEMGPLFQAHGLAHRHFVLVCVRSISTVVAMFLGYWLATPLDLPVYYGVIWGVTLAPLLYYPIQAKMYQIMKMWMPEIDMVGAIPVLCVVAALLWNRLV